MGISVKLDAGQSRRQRGGSKTRSAVTAMTRMRFLSRASRADLAQQLRAGAALAAFAVAVAGCASPWPAPGSPGGSVAGARGVGLADVLQQLREGRPQPDIAADLQAYGLQTVPAPADLDMMAAAGASDELLAALEAARGVAPQWYPVSAAPPGTWGAAGPASSASPVLWDPFWPGMTPWPAWRHRMPPPRLRSPGAPGLPHTGASPPPAPAQRPYSTKPIPGPARLPGK